MHRQGYALVLLLALAISVSSGGSLSEQQRARIDPSFLSVIARDIPQAGIVPAALAREPAALAPDGAPLYDAIIYTNSPAEVRALGIGVNSEYAGFVTARLRATDMVALSALATVRRIEPGMRAVPTVDVSVPETGASLLQAGFLNGTQYKGTGTIVLVYDTGIDWKHPDFCDPSDSTKTRILYIWDQTLTAAGGEAPPTGFSYGVEYTKAQIENELDGTPAGFVRETDINGHGTHVMGIAAGNGSSIPSRRYVGMAPGADLIVVKGGNSGFSESGVIDGITYAKNKATALGKPIVVNMSLGGHTGSHDGDRPYEVAIDSFVTVPGRVASISAGNEGGNAMHIGGALATSDSVSITFSVPAYTPNSGKSNDELGFILFFPSSILVTAKIISPTGIIYQRSSGQFGTGSDATDGSIYLENYLASYNGNRYVYLDVSDADSLKPPKTGTWTLRLLGASAASTWDGWMFTSNVGTTYATLNGGNTSKTIGMPGTARGALTVGSYATKLGWPTASGTSYAYSGEPQRISAFSSIGPTADGRQKPEIAAPGEIIGAAFSRNASQAVYYILPGSRHQVMQGTSMAAPHVTGAVALLLGAYPSLTASDVKNLITATATTDSYTGSVPNDVWGYGKLDVLESMARAISPSATVTRQTMAYDVSGSNVTFELFGTRKYAVRFTAPFTGKVTGFQISLSPQSSRPVVGSGSAVCEVFTNVAGSIGGIPGTRIGSAVQYPFSTISPATVNQVDMSGAGIDVTSGQEYHIVLSLTNQSDTLRFRADTAASTTNNRSSIYSSGTWYNLTDGSSPFSRRNLRLRAVVTTTTGIDGVVGDALIAATYELYQNYPNPFNPSTTIGYLLPAQSEVTLKVFDIMGREVATLARGPQPAGRYQTVWEGKTNAGIPVATGVYFCRLEAGSFVRTQRMMLLK